MTRTHQRLLALLLVALPLLALLAYTALRAGPLAPVAVTLVQLQERSLQPALFGIGQVQARSSSKVGPTVAGRVLRLLVDVGDRVQAGQLLGEMDPVDLTQRLQAQQAALVSARAAQQQAHVKQKFAATQARRYQDLLAAQGVSAEASATKQQELEVADSALAAVRADVLRLQAEIQALQAQRSNLRLLAPAAGLVLARNAEPGTTVVAGQAVLEFMDPASLWVDARFDQVSAQGLAAGLPAQVLLRSRAGQPLAAQVLRLEPRADAVTEELLAKISFTHIPQPLPPLGELAEVTVQLPPLATAPVLPQAALRTLGGQRGVWRLRGNDALVFVPVQVGVADLQGWVQVSAATPTDLALGDAVVLYSAQPLNARSRVKVVTQLAGEQP